MVAIIQCSNGVLSGNSIAKWKVIMYMQCSIRVMVCFPVMLFQNGGSLCTVPDWCDFLYFGCEVNHRYAYNMVVVFTTLRPK